VKVRLHYSVVESGLRQGKRISLHWLIVEVRHGIRIAARAAHDRRKKA
jgi:hypothetical protein